MKSSRKNLVNLHGYGQNLHGQKNLYHGQNLHDGQSLNVMQEGVTSVHPAMQKEKLLDTRNVTVASTSNDDMSSTSNFSHDTGISGFSYGSSTKEYIHSNDIGFPHSRHPSLISSSNSSASKASSTHFSSGYESGIGMRRSGSRSVFSDAEMIHAQAQTLTLTKYFGHDVNRFTEGDPGEPIFDATLRNFIEPHISKARKAREEQRHVVLDKIGIEKETRDSISIASNAFVPYPALRHERPFLFDAESYPLHTILAETLGVSDLSRLHEHSIQDKQVLLSPLLDAKKRNAFHQCYDTFVQSFCIPLIHSIAITHQMACEFSCNQTNQKIRYRYQAFPCLRVLRPKEFSIGPHCDMSYGHSMGNINFHIPLTPTFGTNCVYTESHPGKEDWHPLKTKSVGLGYIFDGARCIHFGLENMTESTRVSLEFRIAIYRDRSDSIPRSVSNAHMMMQNSTVLAHRNYRIGEDECDVHDKLCNPKMLQDNYSIFPGYYDEAYIDVGIQSFSSFVRGPVVRKKNRGLMHPDTRVGFPFEGDQQ
jgi:hypothetical protein